MRGKYSLVTTGAIACRAVASAMSSLVVEQPRGHGVKVAINHNMALLAVKDAACAKRKHNPQAFTLHHKGRKVDLSPTVRFAAIPNTLELVEVPEKEPRGSRRSPLRCSCCAASDWWRPSLPPSRWPRWWRGGRGRWPAPPWGRRRWWSTPGRMSWVRRPHHHHAPRAGFAAGQGPAQAEVQAARGAAQPGGRVRHEGAGELS